jgi:hypothetical protein
MMALSQDDIHWLAFVGKVAALPFFERGKKFVLSFAT